MKKSNSESGHAKNVAGFKTLTIGVVSYGTKYKPSNDRISVLNLQTQYTDGSAAKIDTDNMLKTHRDNILDRHNLFKPIKKLSTRVLRALKTSDVDDGIIEQAKAFVYKIRGERMKPLPKLATAMVSETVNAVTAAVIVTHSVSQQSYTNIVDHLNGLLIVLNGEANYDPNETDLTILSLTTLATDMKKSNEDCDTGLFNYNKSVNLRNSALYAPKTGIYDTSMTVKNYISQLFGLQSPEYKLVMKIKFRKLIDIIK